MPNIKVEYIFNLWLKFYSYLKWRWWRTTIWTWCRGRWTQAPSLTFSTNSLPSLRQVLRAFQLRSENGDHHGENILYSQRFLLLHRRATKRSNTHPKGGICWIFIYDNLDHFRRSLCQRKTYGRYRRTDKRRIITIWVSYKSQLLKIKI